MKLDININPIAIGSNSNWITGLLLALLLLTGNVFAADYDIQVIDSGRVVANQEVNLRVSLLNNAADGTAMFVETHKVMTAPDGQASFTIGDGKVVTGDFNQIDVGTGVYFVKVEADLRGDENFQLVSNSRLQSVSRVQKWLFANEKLNTVLIIIIVIWVGIVVYLLLTGMRVTKIENELKKMKQDAGS
jgi:CcmD family protein